MSDTMVLTEPVEMTIGWTISDMENGYSSFSGYKQGAQQVTKTITIEAPVGSFAEQIAEAVFQGTNAPPEFLSSGSMAAQVAGCLASLGFRGQGAHYSLSTGDTVTVMGVTLAVESLGFKEVTL
jgi:hypothetical protein